MNLLPDLRMSLLDLLHELRDAGIPLIVGGGFGIVLRVENARVPGQRTLLREWPEPRSTNDLDLFLRPELLIHAGRLTALRNAVAALGYTPVPGAENYQFARKGASGSEVGGVKIDLLTGPASSFAGTSVKADARRARPVPSVGIHAHPVDEAPTLEEGLLPMTLKGTLSSGGPWQCAVLLPNAYTFLMMKLCAFHDRLNDSTKDLGRYHALDLYSIMATTTESEWRQATALRDRMEGHPQAARAGALVAKLFASPEALGALRLRESPYYRPQLQLADFLSALHELFPGE